MLAAMSIGAITAALFAGVVARKWGQILPTVFGYLLIIIGMSLFAYGPKVRHELFSILLSGARVAVRAFGG